MRLAPPNDIDSYKTPLEGDEAYRFILSHRIKFKMDGEWQNMTVEDYIRGTEFIFDPKEVRKFLTMFPCEYEYVAMAAVLKLRDSLKGLTHGDPI